MSIIQPIPTKGVLYRKIANNLVNGAQSPTRYVLLTTVERYEKDESLTVIPSISEYDQKLCGIILKKGQSYCLVRSPKFYSRWYVVYNNQCSCLDEKVKKYCLNKVQESVANAAD